MTSLTELGAMYRLFSMFPTGLPGIGLMLLRGAVSVASLAYLGHSPVLTSWIGEGMAYWLTAAIATSLMIGWLTPLAAALSLLLQCTDLVIANHLGWPGQTTALLTALALLLLGPGHYSIDSVLYGHRRLTVPEKS